eukprot:TRINITY_DN1518_c0_g1_i1.p1 TRINITY_DN1518_c0_g1~~TRINITY_DN1518_c0_g1_i1.p1  ORF type:complete len:313 (+),score=120.76 TRINITY_DN1518_c0_g1_i1:80-1018(+)
MMSRSVLLAFAVLFSAVYVLSSSSIYTIPVLAWSPIPSFFTSTTTLATVSSRQFDASISSLLGASNSDVAFSSDKQVEIVVLFVEQQLRTDQVSKYASAGQFSGIKALVDGAASSFVAPYAVAGEEGSLVQGAVEHAAALDGAKVVLATQEGSYMNAANVDARVALEDLASFLASSDILSNGQADLLVVSFASGAAHDAQVSEIIAAVAARTNKYAAIYTAASAPAPPAAEVVAESHMYSRFFFDDANNQTNCTGNGTTIVYDRDFFIGTMLEVYVISAILLSIVLCGLCNMWELQTPERFDPPKAGAKMVM